MLTDIKFTMRAVSVRNSKFQVYGSHRWSTNLFFSPSWVAFAHLALLVELPSDILWYDKSNVVAQTSFVPRQTAPPRSFDASSDESERLLVFGWRTSERRRHPFRVPSPSLAAEAHLSAEFLSCGKLSITLKPLLPKGYHNLLSMHNGNRSNISSTQQDKHAVGVRRGVSKMVCGRRGAKEEVR